MKLHRMFEILYLLLQQRKSTADELAEYFEVSKRTILRDIDALAMAGIPIYTQKGRGGGIFLMDQFVLDKRLLTQDDQHQILMALESLAITEQSYTQGTLSKIRQLFKQPEDSWIQVDLSGWGNSQLDNVVFEQLKTAIFSQQLINIHYVNAKGQARQYALYPKRLVFKSKYWYLLAFSTSHQSYRLYKLSRIRQLTLTNNTVSMNLPPVPTSGVEFRGDASQLVELELNFKAEVSYRVYDEFAVDTISLNQDGTLTVKTQLPDDNWLYSFLLSLGTSVQIVSPVTVKKTMHHIIEGMVELYQID